MMFRSLPSMQTQPAPRRSASTNSRRASTASPQATPAPHLFPPQQAPSFMCVFRHRSRPLFSPCPPTPQLTSNRLLLPPPSPAPRLLLRRLLASWPSRKVLLSSPTRPWCRALATQPWLRIPPVPLLQAFTASPPPFLTLRDSMVTVRLCR